MLTIITFLIAGFLGARLIVILVRQHRAKAPLPEDGMTPDERVAAFNAAHAKK